MVIHVGDVVKVPKTVSETGFIKIVADQTNCLPVSNSFYTKWDYKAVVYNPSTKTQPNFSTFAITKMELIKWAS